METKRMVLAVALSMAVLLTFNYFAPKRPMQPAPAELPAAAAPSAAPSAATAGAQPAGIQAAATPETRVLLENDRVTVEVSSRGGAVVGARLKAYHDKAGKGGNPVTVLGSASRQDSLGDARLAGGGLAAGENFREVDRAVGRVTYAWDAPSGLHVEKTYTLEPGRYDLGLTVRLRNGGGTVVKDRLGILAVRDYSEGEDKYLFTGPSYLRDGKLVEVKLKELKKEPKSESGEIPWAALLEKYFLVAVVPANGAGSSVRIDRHRGQEKVVEVETFGPAVELAPGGEAVLGYRIYLGPKQAEALAVLGAQLERAIDYGWFSIIARPLLAFLKAIYRFTGNYGIAIIVLTTLVKAVFWPLSAKSFRSMQKMKDLQPKMQKLKERYAKDRERLNMEVMQLYKTHKVNPLGGCLPMLVQIPVFFALYRVLLSAIELRHAPFFLWINDLSVPDRLGFGFELLGLSGVPVLTLLMGLSMFLQQKMTPATGVDPVQAKMMLYGMPALFTFMFLNFPSGLVLYWLINNVLSIAQQGLMMRQAKAEAG